MKPTHEEIMNKIDKYVDYSNLECWIFSGGLDANGRPKISFDYIEENKRKVVTVTVHKYLSNANSRYIDNVCGNSRCVNPKHNLPRTFDMRFWGNVTKPNGDDGCWEWEGKTSKSTGYGTVTIDGKSCLVHRIAYSTYYDEVIPEGLMVCHRCNNKKCINPTHLYVGTHNDNMRDMANSDVMKGENNPKALLTKDKVVEIKKLILERRVVYRKIAEMFGVSRQAIKDIASGRTWSWV